MELPKFEAYPEQIEYAREYLKQGGIANRGEFDGDYNKQLFGLIAQIIVCDYLELPRPINEKKFDGGYDLIYRGLKLDVKCELRWVNFNQRVFVHNLVASQINYDSDGYIFLSYNQEKGEYTLCGWITKDDLKKNASFFKEGEKRIRTDGTFMIVKTDLYELKQKHLIPLK